MSYLYLMVQSSTFHAFSCTGFHGASTIAQVGRLACLSSDGFEYQPETALILPGYFIPYLAAQDGPIHSGNKQFDFIMNALLSMNLVVTLLVATILDNTILSSQQERGKVFGCMTLHSQ
ncbi:hypothetical protein HanRHA438_Chr13g0586701 [Helianthus annuus]|nr:hypothetical protein HanRHA438_Chr13g0586701 [Helianthus annuus]